MPAGRAAGCVDAHHSICSSAAITRCPVPCPVQGMESKALAWLQAAWPQGAKSVGATVLQAMKQL